MQYVNESVTHTLRWGTLLALLGRYRWLILAVFFATVLTGLHPSGQVLVHGERWQARVAEGAAEPGERVRVTGQQGLELEVAHEPDPRAAHRMPA